MEKLDCFERYICAGGLDENKPTSRFWKPKQQQNAVRGSSYHNCKCLQQFMWVQRLILMLIEFFYCQIVSRSILLTFKNRSSRRLYVIRPITASQPNCFVSQIYQTYLVTNGTYYEISNSHLYLNNGFVASISALMAPLRKVIGYLCPQSSFVSILRM